MGFSQSEKVKSGVIWLSQSLQAAEGLPGPEKQGSDKILRMLMGMIVQEVRLAEKITGDPAWDAIESRLEQALVMLESGVGAESIVHLTEALSMVTNIGQRCMTALKEEGLL